MAGPTKADLLDDARARGLDVSERNTKAELTLLIAESKAVGPHIHRGGTRCSRCGRINPHVHPAAR